MIKWGSNTQWKYPLNFFHIPQSSSKSTVATNIACMFQEGEEEADEENDPDYDPKVSDHWVHAVTVAFRNFEI